MAAARAAAGIERDDLARMLKMNPLRLWRLETGKTRVLAEDVERIAGALGISVAEVYGAEAKAS